MTHPAPVMTCHSEFETAAADQRRREGAQRFLLPGIGVAAALLTAVGFSGVGDAPAPFGDARAMADHFQMVRTDVFAGAAVGFVGVAALSAFVLSFGQRARDAGRRSAAAAMTGGLAAVVTYVMVMHVIYATLAYNVAGMSAEATKALFVLTIVAVPVFGFGVAAMLTGALVATWRTDPLPRWWRLATGAGSALAVVAMFSYADSGFFSPDVQQQVVGNVLLVWTLITAAATRPGRAHESSEPLPHGVALPVSTMLRSSRS